MEKAWLFAIGIIILILLITIGFLGISAKTGSVIYGKCWNLKNSLEKDAEISLKMQGCIVEDDRTCCPFESCPHINGISCS